MGEGPPTEFTGHLLLDAGGAAVSFGLMALQRPLVGELLGALRALLLTLLGRRAALNVGQHAALVGETLLTPAAGERPGGGGGGVSWILCIFVFIFSLLLAVFFLSLLLLLFIFSTSGAVVLL